MRNKFKIFRSRLLFIGLELDEMMSVEVSFNRYSVSYSKTTDALKSEDRLDKFDLICVSESELKQNQDHFISSQVPFVSIGKTSVVGAAGLLKRPIFIRDWLELVEKLVEAVKTPILEKIEIGAIVRSKTTPIFGKGIVIAPIGPDDFMVKFPNTELLAKDKAIRCHKSQLQILGRIEDYIKD